MAAQAAQQKVIETFMNSLDVTTLKGAAALNEAITTLSSGSVKTMQALINQMVADCKATGDATKFLKDYCGIILDNTDTGAITGSDAGYSTTAKTDVSIVPESGTLTNYTDDYFTLAGGLKISLSGGYASISDSSVNKNDVKQYIWSALKQWWAKGSFDLIKASYGNNYGVDTLATNALGTDNVINVSFINKNNGTLASAGYRYYTAGRGTPAEYVGVGVPNSLIINTYYYGSVPTGAEAQNGKSSSAAAGYLDRTLAHELTHSIMQNNIRYFNNLPQFIKEGMAELTHGIDDERKYRITQLAGNSTALKNALNINNIGTGSEPAYAGGYMFLRYLAKEMQTPKYTTVTGGDYYSNYNNTSVVNALAGNDTVRNRVENATIDGGAGNDYLINASKNVILIGNAGNDSITSSGANVSIDGGAGNDSITNSGANVTINAGAADTIQHTNYIYNSGKNVSIFSGASSDTIESKAANVTIDSGAGADSIIAATKTTVTAGAGNDTLAGAGNNVYMFGNSDGNNLITKFVPGTDVIYLTGITSADDITLNTLKSSDDTNLVLTAGNTVVTVAGAAVAGAKVRFHNGTKLVTQTLKSKVFGDNRDLYDNFKAGARLNALGGNDSIGNMANNVVINGGEGNDDLFTASTTANVTLNGGAGDDSLIANFSTKTMLIGGAGDDFFTVGGSKHTINCGAGTDEIAFYDNSAGNTIVYGNNDGWSTIYGLNGSDVLYLNGVNNINTVETVEGYVDGYGNVAVLSFGKVIKDSFGNVAERGSNVIIVNPGTVKVRLSNNKVVTLREQDTPTTYADFINNYDSVGATSYNLLAGNDTLNNYVANATINGDAGDDYIYNYKAAAGSQLIGGAGNDSLYTQAENVKIDGGADNDYLNSAAANVTITGGTGIDTIALNAKTAKANVINYAAGDGNDVITGFNGDDTLNITSGGQFVTVKSGANLLVKIVGSDDYITLKNIGKANITGAALSNGYPTNANLGMGTIQGSSGNRVIKIFPAVLSTSSFSGSVDLRDYPTAKGFYVTDTSGGVTVKGNWQNDYLIGGAGNDSLNGYAGNNTLVGGAGNDTLIGSAGNDSLYGGAGNDVFVYSGGKDIIADYASGDIVDFGQNSVTSYAYSGNNLVFKVGANTVTVQNGKTLSVSYKDANGSHSPIAQTSALIAEDYISNNDVLIDEIIGTPIVGDFETGSSTRDTVQSALAYSEDF